MNLILVAPGELDAVGCVELSGRRAVHVRDILGAKVGDEFRVGVVRGAQGVGRVRAVDAERVRLQTVGLDRLEQAIAPRVDLIVAVPRPKVLSRMLRTAASFGIGHIDLINAWRVEKSYFGSPRLQGGRMAADLTMGCEQGCSTWIPTVAVHRRFCAFVGDSLSARLAASPGSQLVCADPAGTDLETIVEAGSDKRVVLAIGPEGGWIDRELRTWQQMNFELARLGQPILAVEVAVAAALAQIQLLRRL